MFLFHAILFFLLGTYAVALPIGLAHGPEGDIHIYIPTSMAFGEHASGLWYFQDPDYTYVGLLDVEPPSAGFNLVYSSTGTEQCPQFHQNWEWKRVTSVEAYEEIVKRDKNYDAKKKEKWQSQTYIRSFIQHFSENTNRNSLFRIIHTKVAEKDALDLLYNDDAGNVHGWKTLGWANPQDILKWEGEP